LICKKARQPNRRDPTVLRQLVGLIPPDLGPQLARACGLNTVNAQSRTFSPWSHVAAMIYAQVSHTYRLNQVGDARRLHVTALLGLRSASRPPAMGYGTVLDLFLKYRQGGSIGMNRVAAVALNGHVEYISDRLAVAGNRPTCHVGK